MSESVEEKVGWFTELKRSYGEWSYDIEKKYLFEPMGEGAVNALKPVGASLWEWFIYVLPNMVGLGAIASGVMIIVGSMSGTTAMMRPLTYLGSGIITAICVLIGAKG